MKKIDKKLINFVILGENDCVLNAIVYYLNKQKMQDFFIKNNIKIIKDLDFINAFAVCFNSHNLLKTAEQKFVLYVSSVSDCMAMIDVAKKIVQIKDCDYESYTNIAIIDTGINNHLDFVLSRNKILKFVDFVNGKKNNYDDNGHGTFVSSIACGSGILSNKKFSGVCPNSKIISLKALDEKGEANAVQILEAMQWIYENYKKYNVGVVCMSFGSEPLGYGDPIMLGAEKLWDEGIVVVCAGGNSGPNIKTIKSPGISKKIITVGGLNDNRGDMGDYSEKFFEIADFSSRGPALGKIKPDIIAPSVNLTGCNFCGGYKQMSGTSVATPIVAGICAIIKSRFNDATPSQIKKYLIRNAKSIGKSKYEEGYGVVNLKSFFDES